MRILNGKKKLAAGIAAVLLVVAVITAILLWKRDSDENTENHDKFAPAFTEKTPESCGFAQVTADIMTVGDAVILMPESLRESLYCRELEYTDGSKSLAILFWPPEEERIAAWGEHASVLPFDYPCIFITSHPDKDAADLWDVLDAAGGSTEYYLELGSMEDMDENFSGNGEEFPGYITVMQNYLYLYERFRNLNMELQLD